VDGTLSELLTNGAYVTEMKTFLQFLQVWTTSNKMKINYTKTNTSSECVFIERVHHFKVLGINIGLSHDMNWQLHKPIKPQADSASLSY